jgi:hypothetical protein
MCGEQIHWDDRITSPTSGKKIPLQGLEGEDKHNCPNSEFTKRNQQGESYRTPKESSITDFERKSLANDQEMISMLRAIMTGRTTLDQDVE